MARAKHRDVMPSVAFEGEYDVRQAAKSRSGVPGGEIIVPGTGKDEKGKFHVPLGDDEYSLGRRAQKYGHLVTKREGLLPEGGIDEVRKHNPSLEPEWVQAFGDAYVNSLMYERGVTNIEDVPTDLDGSLMTMEPIKQRHKLAQEFLKNKTAKDYDNFQPIFDGMLDDEDREILNKTYEEILDHPKLSASEIAQRLDRLQKYFSELKGPPPQMQPQSQPGEGEEGEDGEESKGQGSKGQGRGRPGSGGGRPPQNKNQDPIKESQKEREEREKAEEKRARQEAQGSKDEGDGLEGGSEKAEERKQKALEDLRKKRSQKEVEDELSHEEWKEMNEYFKGERGEYDPRAVRQTKQRWSRYVPPETERWPTLDHMEGEWAEMQIIKKPLNRRIQTTLKSIKQRPGFAGPFRYVTRAHPVSGDGRAFGHKLRNEGGTVLVDMSGSMSITQSQIDRFMALAPASTMALYGGHHGGFYAEDDRIIKPYLLGDLIIVAQNGRGLKRLDRETNLGMLNLIDGPALDWLIEQRGPRIWVSDGNVTGEHERRYEFHNLSMLEKLKEGRIVQVLSIEDAIEMAKNNWKDVYHTSKKEFGQRGRLTDE